LVISVGPYDAGPNFIWVFDAAAQRLVIPAASVQRWADEIVIWPVVEASWHRTAIRHGSRNTSGSATGRAQRGRIGAGWGTPGTDPHAGLAGTPSRVRYYTATGQ